MNNVYQASRRVLRVARRVKDGVQSGGSSAARILTEKVNGVIAGAREFWAQRQAAQPDNVVLFAPRAIDAQPEKSWPLLHAIVDAQNLLSSGQFDDAKEALLTLEDVFEQWTVKHRGPCLDRVRSADAHLSLRDVERASAELGHLQNYLKRFMIIVLDVDTPPKLSSAKGRKSLPKFEGESSNSQTVITSMPPLRELSKIQAFIADLTGFHEKLDEYQNGDAPALQTKVNRICKSHDKGQTQYVRSLIVGFKLRTSTEFGTLSMDELEGRLSQFIAELETAKKNTAKQKSGSESNSSTEDDSSSGGSLDFS
ncbi:hypothetical protein [Rhizobacter sp. OV335]|uniref:hypothetical protein n=1 Tax=Rhizobacter sp. OV335 TaxID=1500264 RepID=UPI00091F8AF2|nr:hypothetical protein [Rhizobacter sp. OV335]SHM11837.1 hypothetical protein SAMN02787076_00528 [Rhizobacter sp. OV335]